MAEITLSTQMELFSYIHESNSLEKMTAVDWTHSPFFKLGPKTLRISPRNTYCTFKGTVTEDSFLSIVFGPSKNINDMVSLKASIISKSQGLLWEKELKSKAGHSSTKYEVSLPKLEDSLDDLYIGVTILSDLDALIYEFIVSKYSKINLMRASSFYNDRMKNEIDHFTTTYNHKYYQEGTETNKGLGKIIKEFVFKYAYSLRDSSAGIGLFKFLTQSIRIQFNQKILKKLRPIQLNEPLIYSTHLLTDKYLNQSLPDFKIELKKLSQKKENLSILSLCCGEARTERDYLKELAGKNIHITLHDINESLLIKAKEKVQDYAQSVNILVADVNDLKIPHNRYDVVLCVSALHHVVNLEGLFDNVYHSLKSDGQFWSIGECISKNGNQLWPDIYEVANDYFKKLPQQYRKNAFSNKIDEELIAEDFSTNCFEGIRSEEIEFFIHKYFTPINELKYDCFTWRIFSLMYINNYNLSTKEDQLIVENACTLDHQLLKDGKKPSTLYGIYKKNLMYQ